MENKTVNIIEKKEKIGFIKMTCKRLCNKYNYSSMKEIEEELILNVDSIQKNNIRNIIQHKIKKDKILFNDNNRNLLESKNKNLNSILDVTHKHIYQNIDKYDHVDIKGIYIKAIYSFKSNIINNFYENNVCKYNKEFLQNLIVDFYFRLNTLDVESLQEEIESRLRMHKIRFANKLKFKVPSEQANIILLDILIHLNSLSYEDIIEIFEKAKSDYDKKFKSKSIDLMLMIRGSDNFRIDKELNTEEKEILFQLLRNIRNQKNEK